jgi:hypothetical protein
MLKPTHYDLPSLTEHVPATYIATPVLKSTGAVNIPALDDKSKLFSWWDANQRQTFFIYGGNWMAEFESPAGLQSNGVYGRSSNQEMVNGSSAVGLSIEDQVFLRPDPDRSRAPAIRRPAGRAQRQNRRHLARLHLTRNPPNTAKTCGSWLASDSGLSGEVKGC